MRQSTGVAGPSALHFLYSRHGAGIRRYLARMVGEADAEDLVHDVFERALTAHDVEERAAAWLYRIARNAAVDRLRSRTAREREDVIAVLHEMRVPNLPRRAKRARLRAGGAKDAPRRRVTVSFYEAHPS